MLNEDPFASRVDLSKAALVVAHPDDEILWFSSIVTKVSRVIMCYGTISPNSMRAAQRRRVIRSYPLNQVEFLDMPIPANTGCGDETYCHALVEHLTPALRGVTAVFTHNPWGEYGQRDHKRVHSAIASLGEQLKCAIYISCYTARHQLAEAIGVLGGRVDSMITLPVQDAEVDRVVALYKENSCWTWAPNWKWPAREHFLRLENSSRPAVKEVPLNIFGSWTKSRAEMRLWWRQLLPARPKEFIARV